MNFLNKGKQMSDGKEADIPEQSSYHLRVKENHCPPSMFFNNLVWLTTKEAALYLRKSVNSIHLLVSRRQLRARKFRNRLYFKKVELEHLIETSKFTGGF